MSEPGHMCRGQGPRGWPFQKRNDPLGVMSFDGQDCQDRLWFGKYMLDEYQREQLKVGRSLGIHSGDGLIVWVRDRGKSLYCCGWVRFAATWITWCAGYSGVSDLMCDGACETGRKGHCNTPLTSRDGSFWVESCTLGCSGSVLGLHIILCRKYSTMWLPQAVRFSN
jgi:hypothetical protein